MTDDCWLSSYDFCWWCLTRELLMNVDSYCCILVQSGRSCSLISACRKTPLLQPLYDIYGSVPPTVCGYLWSRLRTRRKHCRLRACIIWRYAILWPGSRGRYFTKLRRRTLLNILLWIAWRRGWIHVICGHTLTRITWAAWNKLRLLAPEHVGRCVLVHRCFSVGGNGSGFGGHVEHALTSCWCINNLFGKK